MQLKQYKWQAIIMLIMLSVYQIAMAANQDKEVHIETVTDVENVLKRVADMLFTLLLIVAVIFVILAGFKYLQAGGDPEKFKEANRMILYAVIALAIGFIAKGVPNIVRTIIEGK